VNPDTSALMAKARRSFDVARQLHADGHHDFAAGRAYYAMFYMAEAALLERQIVFASHRALHAGFFRQLIDTGEIDRVHHQSLVRGFELRQAGDYGGLASVSPDQCADLLRRTQAFIDPVHPLIEPAAS